MFNFRGTRKPDFRAGRVALSYDNYWDTRGMQIERKLKPREEMMLKLAPSGSRILIVGAGTSRLPLSLRDKGCTVVVSDISEPVLKLFRDKSFETFPLDLEKISKGSIKETYDIVILSEVLEHVRNPEGAIEALSPHTKRFYITIPNSAFYRFRFHLFFRGRFFTQWALHPAEHLRFWSHTDFLDWLDAMDLDLEMTRSSNGFSLFGLAPWLKDAWKNFFGHQILYVAAPKLS